MAIALTQFQLDTILRRARQIHDDEARDEYFAQLCAALRKLDPPRDADVKRATAEAFARHNLALVQRTKTISEH